MDNEFYRLITDSTQQWDQIKINGGNGFQWEPTEGELINFDKEDKIMMTNADISLFVN